MSKQIANLQIECRQLRAERDRLVRENDQLQFELAAKETPEVFPFVECKSHDCAECKTPIELHSEAEIEACLAATGRDTAIASEVVLAKDWNQPDEDAAWAYLEADQQREPITKLACECGWLFPVELYWVATQGTDPGILNTCSLMIRCPQCERIIAAVPQGVVQLPVEGENVNG
jgi:hypothetical protein